MNREVGEAAAYVNNRWQTYIVFLAANLRAAVLYLSVYSNEGQMAHQETRVSG